MLVFYKLKFNFNRDIQKYFKQIEVKEKIKCKLI